MIMQELILVAGFAEPAAVRNRSPRAQSTTILEHGFSMMDSENKRFK
jgi:hypothetical protein